MSASILVVDDTAEIRDLVRSILSEEGYQVQECESGAALRRRLAEEKAPDLVLLDLRLPDAEGLDLLPAIKREWPGTEVLIMTGYATIEAAVTATKMGAYGFQEKPFDPAALVVNVSRALEHKALQEQASQLRQALSTMSGGAAPVFQSAAMKSVVKMVEKVAASDVSVFIVGESGTGKEVIADLIHNLSPRAGKPFIKVNCAALPRELIESELFGSVKGAFTGATADRVGLFRQAEGGTLLLDEISEMPVDTQSKLLRVLQDKEVRPVGGRASYTINCRIIAATNRPIQEAIRTGKLREDLYYRISTITLTLPPLRDRREDILPLANAFLQRFAAQAGRSFTGFSAEAAQRLRHFDWPGNVRQLQNEVQRAVLIAAGPQIEVADLSIGHVEEESAPENLSLMDAMERNTILKVLQETGGNKVEAARRLGIGRQTLYNKIKSYGIEA
ncbi:sigma-54 dependent transcriptional regulator [Fontisphaera persica]|uniref:sigma-54-dependent transcriptional regulator n=1 Tax=Fontisphaera persica TaxID=2974023 RepID=UPI0024BF2356|nr:sigma-54 dependent transcriptional regulator [Fontisphaera persica]WCJ60140.1 sigma-54 dependent transcriptional regulator [Fontisphaera persica]